MWVCRSIHRPWQMDRRGALRRTERFAASTRTTAETPDGPADNDGETEEMEANASHATRTEILPPQPAAPVHLAKVRIADNERVVFVEESEPNQYLKVVASGEVDEIMLDALSDYVKRQKRRLGVSVPAPATGAVN